METVMAMVNKMMNGTTRKNKPEKHLTGWGSESFEKKKKKKKTSKQETQTKVK